MKKSVDVRLLVVAVVFGFLGGAASSLLLPGLVFAQGEPVNQITAHEFRVVDLDGNVLVAIGGNASSKIVSMRSGKVESMRLPAREGRIEIFDSDGRVLASVPQPLVHPLSSGHGGE